MILSFLLVTQTVSAPTFPFRTVAYDTTLVKSRSKDNFGREDYVLGGEGRVALVKFPDIQYQKPSGQKVKSATLVLNLALPDSVGQIDVRRLLLPWGEGRGRSIPNMSTKPGDPIAFGNSNWEWASFSDNDGKWNSGGASHEQDARTIDGIQAQQTGKTLKLTGFATTVQNWIENPTANHGIRLEFSADAAFNSGETPERPRLEIEWEPAPANGPDLAILSIEPDTTIDPKAPSTWTATLINQGNDAAQTKATWRLPNGRNQTADIPESIPSKATAKIKLDLPVIQNYGDPRRALLTLSVSTQGDQNPADNSLTVPVGGTTISVGNDQSTILIAQQAIRFINDVAFPFSRSSFAPEGITERLRLVTTTTADTTLNIAKNDAGNPEIWPWPAVDYNALTQIARSLTPVPSETKSKLSAAVYSGIDKGQIGNLADTRDDALRFRGLAMPNPAWYIPRPIDPPLRESGFFSRVESGYLQANIGKIGQERGWQNIKLPNAVVINFTDTQGNPIETGEVEAHAVSITGEQAKSYGKSRLSRGGIISVKTDSNLNFNNPWLSLNLIRSGNTDNALISIWDLYDWVIRGNTIAAAVDVRMMTTDIELSLDSDLAENKIVTDSAGRFPAEIGALVKPQNDQQIDLAPGNWVEIDLGRDRTFGAVQIDYAGKPFESFEIYTFKTGQNPAEARPFFRDPQAQTTANLFGQNQDGKTTVLYKAASVQSRYIRIINNGSTPSKLTRIYIRPAKSG